MLSVFQNTLEINLKNTIFKTKNRFFLKTNKSRLIIILNKIKIIHKI